MTEREQVIAELLYLKHDCLEGSATDQTLNKAIALLKAQEPMVMTWQDIIGAAIECKPLYIEVKDSEDKEPGDDRWAMVTQYKDSITNGMIRAMSSYVTSEILFAEDYGKRWRCWISRPTDEQREATSWNE
jgi:hypothetical protein